MASSNKPKRSKIDTGEIGQSGTNVQFGIISGEEYNPDLLGRQKFAKYNEMRLGNVSASTSLEAIKLPIISAKFTVEAASTDPADEDIAAKLEYNLFTHLDWNQTLREALTYLDFGFSLMEEVYEAGEIAGSPMILLDRLALRKATSIQAWETQDHQPGVTQMTSIGKMLSIPMDKMLHLAHKKEGDNYEGVSVLRTSYANWYYLTTFYKIDALGYERQALGVLDIEYPMNANESDKQNLVNAARNIRANEQSYLMRPAGYTVQWMDMKAGTLKDPTKAIEHHMREIAKNVMAQFNEIGSGGSSGAYSASQTQYELFILAVQAIADAFVDAFNRQVVKTWVDLNYNVTDYPKLQVARIGDDNMESVVKSLALLVDAGMITPTDDDEAYFRRRFELPDLPEELRGKDRKPKTAQVKDKNAPPANDQAEEGTEPVKASSFLARAKRLKQAIEDKLYGPRKAA